MPAIVALHIMSLLLHKKIILLIFTSGFLPSGRMITKKHTSVLHKVIFNIQPEKLKEAANFPFIFIYTEFSNNIFSCSREHLFDCLFTQMHFRSRKYLCQVEEEDVKCFLLQSNFQILPGTLAKQN